MYSNNHVLSQPLLKTYVVFINLLAVYDTVWKDGLLNKFVKVIPCTTLFTLLDRILTNRRFQVLIGKKKVIGVRLPMDYFKDQFLFLSYLIYMYTTCFKERVSNFNMRMILQLHTRASTQEK